MGYSQLGKLKDKVSKEDIKSEKDATKAKAYNDALNAKKGKCDDRSGRVIYRTSNSLGGNTDYHEYAIHYVEVNDKNTIVYLSNYGYYHDCLPEIGSEGAPYLQVAGSRDYIRAVGYGPELVDGKVSGLPHKCAPRSNYSVIFPRVEDYVCAITFQMPASLELNAKMVFDVAIDAKQQKISPEEFDSYLNWDNCSFNGTESIDEGSSAKFFSKQPGVSSYQWKADGALSITGAATQKEVSIKGTKSGTGKVCLKITYQNGVVSDCESCKTVTVNTKDTEAPTPVFTMTNCGNFSPKYVFELNDCKADANYKWEVFSHTVHHPVEYPKMKFDDKSWVADQGSGKCSVSDINPQSRLEPFTIKVTATYSNGKSKSYSQQIHPILDCPSQGQYANRNSGVSKLD